MFWNLKLSLETSTVTSHNVEWLISIIFIATKVIPTELSLMDNISISKEDLLNSKFELFVDDILPN